MIKKTALAVAALLAAAIVLGPRPRVDVTERPAPLPDDLDAYLATSEARFDDLREGVEKQIVWADSSREQTDVAVVYLHGFSATREEVRPLPDTVAARLGANLYFARLTGHGRSGEAMGEASVADWVRDAYEALAIGRRLGRRVVLMGTSTGATLALWLAAQPDADPLEALVLISPNFHPKDQNARFLTWPWGTQLGHAIIGPYHEWEPKNEEQARYWTVRYPVEALVTMMSLVDVVAETDLGAIEAPTLVVYSPNDDVVDVARIEARFPEFGAERKELIAIDTTGDPSNHVLAGAVLAPEMTLPLANSIAEFLAPVE